jgi:hypothetical protein
VAITVHFEREGQSFSLLLDLVEVPRSHTRFNLEKAFADVLYDFGIETKVRTTRKDVNNASSP